MRASLLCQLPGLPRGMMGTVSNSNALFDQSEASRGDPCISNAFRVAGAFWAA